MESDGSANRPRVPPAVHYPRSSAGPNELILSSRADTESKREERERKRKKTGSKALLKSGSPIPGFPDASQSVSVSAAESCSSVAPDAGERQKTIAVR